jgi:mono/diheme cytochrome c family protein
MTLSNVKRILTIVAVLLAGMAARASDAAGIEFFEKKIRPVLVDQCYKCHAEGEKVKGGLLLDTRAGLLKGGDTGPSIVPGEPDKSLLIKAIRYTDEELKMPPKDKKLSAEQIADFEAWVKMGAPDPRTNTTKLAAVVTEEARKHWAYQPVRSPAAPKVRKTSWMQQPLDAFVLAKLEFKGLKPSPQADRRTLIRRASYDVTGLPPTPEEVEAFVADKSPDAYRKLVDRLLASPHYGERWARYWLDIARYADTKGYVFEEERRYPFSYTYRDYVIRALNEDLPYDQFIIQQLAADLLPLGEDKRPLAALGFMTLGRRFLNNQPDIIDDRIDVMSRGLMAMTVACARCHDHKFDPISTKDYYSLYGVFASSEEPNEKPLLGNKALPKEYPEYLVEKKKRDDELKNYQASEEAKLLAKMRAQVGEYLLAVHDTRKLAKDKREAVVRERKLFPSVATRWERRLETLEEKNDPVFAPWFAFAALPATNFAEAARPLAARFASNNASNKLNTLVAALFTNAPNSLSNVAERYDQLFASIDKQWRDSATQTNAPAALASADAEALRQVIYSEKGAFALNSEEMYRLFDTPAQQKVRALRRKVEELDATHAGAPPRAMALVDKATPVEPVVFVRGNPGNHGPKVPRQFLEILSEGKREPFKKGSGRLELAQSIASTNNPLTARTMVNRVWAYYFGTPLVRTPSDFGVKSDPPTNPELLDHLASEFMASGWSLKKLHRSILLSAAYQQSSAGNEANEKIDPANENYWRQNRRRLDFEAMRDTLLTVSAKLDKTMGGRPVEITSEPFAARRTVYAYIERQNLPGLFRTFDFASPDATSPQRFYTTVPQQALFLMNSPFVVQQSQAVLNRPELKEARSDEERIRRMYRVAFQREPDRDELAAGRQFIAAQATATNTAAPEIPVWQYGFGEFDEQTGKVKFTRLPKFTGGSYQGGDSLPDAKLGWVMLNAEGGHVGNDAKHAAVRRWRAPRDGVVKVSGEFAHGSDKGDGVRGRVVSSSAGKLGEWLVHNSKATAAVERVEVKKGDYIDFVADLRQDVSFDSFAWAPRVRYLDSTGGKREAWNAKNDFAAPARERKPLTAWEKYAQVLLLSNELMFID